MSEKLSSSFWGMFAIALALVIAALLASSAIKQVKRANETITVTGSAKKPIRADYVVWRGAVTAQRPTLQEAYREVTRYGERLRAYLRDNQVPDSAVTLRPLDTQSIPETVDNGRMTGRILAYTLRQNFEVHSANVEVLTKLAGRASELINEGIALESYPLEYFCTQIPQLRSAMLAEAAQDAKVRAVAIAGSVGSKIGPVRSARMGVFQITARNSTDVSDYGVYDTSSLEKDITAVVSVTFAVE
jgi:uncharacterized protein